MSCGLHVLSHVLQASQRHDQARPLLKLAPHLNIYTRTPIYNLSQKMANTTVLSVQIITPSPSSTALGKRKARDDEGMFVSSIEFYH